jgi:hypothetical protein
VPTYADFTEHSLSLEHESSCEFRELSYEQCSAFILENKIWEIDDSVCLTAAMDTFAFG